ncbi:MAG: LysM peptidoglycan-binding domain-containing protein [Acidimicrobiia bacterium]
MAFTYTVQRGDTLRDIARRLLGDASRWPEIVALSGGVRSGDPDLILPGETLTVPSSGEFWDFGQNQLVTAEAPASLTQGATFGSPTPPGSPTPSEPADPTLPPPAPPPVPPVLPPPSERDVSDISETDTRTGPVPGSERVNFRARAQALYPFLPAELLDIFARAWAETGDVSLALAQTRADPAYDRFFPGIKRDDGSLRLSEAEYLSRMDGYKLILGQFNLNPEVFQNRLVEAIEGELSVGEFASRMSAAYSQIISFLPQAREFYASNYGLELTDEAIFASFIDPDLGNAVLSQRIAVSQIGGAAAAAGFNLDLTFAERIRQRGLDFGQAQGFFDQAREQIPTLGRLAQRFGVDKTVDLGEFAGATIFADPFQRRRVRRLLAAEASSFTPQEGRVRTQGDFTVTGLSPR